MILELKDPNSAPYVAPMRLYTPEQRKMIQAEIETLHKAGAIVPLRSQYASCRHTVRKEDHRQRSTRLTRSQCTPQGPKWRAWRPPDHLRRNGPVSVLLLSRSHLGNPTTNDPRGRQAPHRVPRCRREAVGVRTLGLWSQDGTVSFCQLRRRQHYGSKKERSA